MQFLRKTVPLFILLICVILLQSFYSGENHHESGNDVAWPTTRELRSKLFELRQVLVVYGTGNPAASSRYQQFLETADSHRWLKTAVKPDTAVTEEELRSLPLLLYGTPTSNQILARFLESLPLNSENEKLSIPGIMTLQQNDVYTLMYPNPLERSLPISVKMGNNDEAILEHMQQTRNSYFPTGEFSVYRNGKRVILGFYEQTAGRPWKINAEDTHNYLKNTHFVEETSRFRYIYHGDRVPSELRQFINTAESRAQNLLQTLSAENIAVGQLPVVEIHLYGTAEDKGLITHNTDLSHFDLESMQVHLLYSDYLKGDDFYSEAGLILTHFLGESKSKALQQGLAMKFTYDWRKRGALYWAQKMYQSGNVNSLKDILNNDVYEKESYLVMRPLAGSFVEFLLEHYGWQTFLQLYKAEAGPDIIAENMETSLQQIEQEWHHFLSQIKGDDNLPSVEPPTDLPGFQKGFCYAHEGYQIFDGYLSRKSYKSLKKLRSLGTEWVSITPFGYVYADKPGYVRNSFGAGSENDESVVIAKNYAKSLGMGVMLKPHILLRGPHWGWPGDVKMQSEDDWQAFFKYYYKWIRHYALLAEMYEMDIFCIGVELVHATVGHEEDWREMIEEIRKIYHGPIVYAANWGDEFEQIKFWDALDYIGLNCYYPLSDKNSATVADLKEGITRFLPKIEKVALKYDKPVIFTEVGFTSTAKNWQQPHERRRQEPVYYEDQVKSYRAMFEALWQKEWFYGFYWWKWPTYLEYGGDSHNGFTPSKKPAEDVVQKWYSQKPPKRPEPASGD